MSPEQLIPALRTALHAASQAVLALYEAGSYEVSQKADDSPLTSADLAANRILREHLTRLDPAAGWLSEETEDTAGRLACERVWIVDPIDGTRDFVRHTGAFSISVGLAEHGRPVCGAVALPVAREIVIGGPQTGVSVWQFDEAGSFREERPVFSRCRDLRTARVMVSESEWKRGAFDAARSELSFEPTGSIARKLALLAAGRTDLVVSLYPKNEWDICGGLSLVAGQAGSRALELEQRGPFVFNRAQPRSIGLVAGPGELVEQWLEYQAHMGLVLHDSYEH